VRYQFIKGQEEQFTVAALCRVMQVSQSGYYAWRKRPECRRSQEDRVLLVQIKSFFEQSRRTYGSPRIYRDFQESGIACGRRRIERLMHQNGIRPEPVRRFVATTDSKHALPVAQNLLDRQFGAPQADSRWNCDITYVWTREGWLYLAVVLDLFSRKIVGWSMQPSLERGLVLDALEMALAGRRPSEGLLCHSDRGSQYASLDYQSLLQAVGIVCSMSRKGNCWDNAPVESFFATLKRELIHRRQYETREEARTDIFQYIEIWYNRRRRHSSVGYLSPEEFERRAATAKELPLAV
jgi:transposase InsO family protein